MEVAHQHPISFDATTLATWTPLFPDTAQFEYGWETSFEAYVARLVADIIDHFNPARQRCWIAESKQTLEFLGCIALVKDRNDANTAQLRLLLVEATARGTGLGGQLIEKCVAFAVAKGYQKVKLSTYSFLEGARRIYKRAGFELVKVDSEKEQYGKKLVNEIWELVLPDERCKT